jgi:hypothetical protein
MLTGAAGIGAAGGGNGGGSVVGTGGAGPVTGTGGFNDGCPPPTPAERAPADILIALDTSASMNDAVDGPCAGGCGTRSKWSVALSGIDAVLDSGNPSVNWGLELVGAGATCDAGRIIIAPAPGRGAAIMTELANRTNAGNLTTTGNRPVRTAIGVATTHFIQSVAVTNPAVLLVTDGAPDCGAGAPDPMASDAAGAAKAIGEAATSGIPTFIVGLGAFDAATDDGLSSMAVAGGFARSGSPAYYPAANATDLATAVNQLILTMGQCIYMIPPPPNSTVSTDRIGVLVNGNEIPQDTTNRNGWSYRDASHTRVQIYGPTCDAILAGSVQSVAIVFKCLLI